MLLCPCLLCVCVCVCTYKLLMCDWKSERVLRTLKITSCKSLCPFILVSTGALRNGPQTLSRVHYVRFCTRISRKRTLRQGDSDVSSITERSSDCLLFFRAHSHTLGCDLLMDRSEWTTLAAQHENITTTRLFLSFCPFLRSTNSFCRP